MQNQCLRVSRALGVLECKRFRSQLLDVLYILLRLLCISFATFSASCRKPQSRLKQTFVVRFFYPKDLNASPSDQSLVRNTLQSHTLSCMAVPCRFWFRVLPSKPILPTFQTRVSSAFLFVRCQKSIGRSQRWPLIGGPILGQSTPKILSRLTSLFGNSNKQIL